MKKGIALIAALIISVLLLGCEEAATYATADDAKAALNGQGVITIDGDFSEPNQASDIRVNNGFAGFMRETGLINGKWTISANYEEWFYVKYVTGEPVNHQEGVNSGSTLGFYDMDDNCLGYAFCQLREQPFSNNMVPFTSLFIDDLCVDASTRGQHIGEKLFVHVKEEAKRLGCYEVTLNVWAGNISAEKFYEKMGLKTKERQMEYIL